MSHPYIAEGRWDILPLYPHPCQPVRVTLSRCEGGVLLSDTELILKMSEAQFFDLGPQFVSEAPSNPLLAGC